MFYLNLFFDYDSKSSTNNQILQHPGNERFLFFLKTAFSPTNYEFVSGYFMKCNKLWVNRKWLCQCLHIGMVAAVANTIFSKPVTTTVYCMKDGVR